MSIDDGKKHQYYDFLIYPDSAPDNFLSILKDSHAPFVLSPLHAPDDQDAKPHYHCIYMHGGPCMFSTALAFLKPIVCDNGIAANGYVEITHHPHGYMRYLLHLDDPEKEQFDGGRYDCTVLNAFPLDLTRELSREELRDIRRNIFAYIRKWDITEYSQLIDDLDGDEEWLDYVCNHTILFNGYLTSRRNAKKKHLDED